ncbi:MAG TPA: hypothetical protein VFO52_01975 [Longimicrobiales bacterium]|nr:hypothetical protein [Longimicrobiales bacterium]
MRDRYPNTPAAAQAERLLALLQRTISDDSGRTELIVFGTTYGALLGVAVPVAVRADEPEAFGLGLIVGAPAGFLAARAYARSRSLSEGQASAIISGATWGTWQAFGWMEVFDWGENEYCDEAIPGSGEIFCYETDAEGHAVVKTMVAGSLVGLGVGALLSQKNITRGTAATVNLGALWGTWFGIAAAILADQDTDPALTTVLLAGNAGLLGGALGNSRWRLSEPRVRLISVAGLGGLLAGAGILLIAQPQGGDNSAVLVPLAGSIAGLALGTHWTRHMPREAAIDVGHRRLGWQLPSVQPALVDGEAGRRVPALRVNLLQARF